MRKSEYLSTSDHEKVAKKILDDIYKPVNSFKTTIFLCGADVNVQDTIRSQMNKYLSEEWYGLFNQVIMPEELFEELLYGNHQKDLLSLENLLAESVDVIMIIPESPGSIAELGAFSMNVKLREKIICLVDKQYKKNRSFINQGPIKLIKKVNGRNVIYIDPANLGKSIIRINESIRGLKKVSSKIVGKVNLLQLENFLIPLLFLFDPIDKETLSKFVFFVIEDTSFALQASTIAITSLTKKKFIELTIGGYKLTDLGIKRFRELRHISTRVKQQKETVAIDNIRLELENLCGSTLSEIFEPF